MNEDKIRKAIDALKECNGVILNNEAIIKELDGMLDPSRICGLTMDEWKIVIDGGYLCEFRRTSAHSLAAGIPEWLNQKCKLEKTSPDSSGSDFYTKGIGWIDECRPYRAVGHIQPYFDNDECKAYLDGLKMDADLYIYDNDGNGFTRREFYNSKKWRDVKAFIVLSND